MASVLLKAYTDIPSHAVGNINSWKIRVVPNGALVATAAIDNFTIGELGFNSDGERTVVQLSDNTKTGVLVAAPERRYIDGELMAGFYNDVGDRARVVILDFGIRFETSAFSKNTDVTTISNGMAAHFDVTTKKFIISTAASPHSDYANAGNKYVVVATDSETIAIDGQKLVRLEVIV